MKTVLLTLLFFGPGTSCNMFQSKIDLVDFIPGAYVSEWTTEFAESKDTLLIQPNDHAQTSSYLITRKTYHQYNQQTKPLPSQRKLEKWIGNWSSQDQVLIVAQNGRVITFQPSQGQLRMGIKIYRKL